MGIVRPNSILLKRETRQGITQIFGYGDDGICCGVSRDMPMDAPIPLVKFFLQDNFVEIVLQHELSYPDKDTIKITFLSR